MGNHLEKANSGGKSEQPTPIDFVSGNCGKYYTDPFWSQILKRSHSLQISGLTPYGPCSQNDWEEVTKICGQHKQYNYPPFPSNNDYMKECYK